MDMVHNHYLDEAKKKTQERDRNSKTSMMPSARFQSTANGSKTKPWSTNQSTRSLPISKSSRVTITAMPQANHSKSSSSFSDSITLLVLHVIVFSSKDFRWWIPTGKLFDSYTSKDDNEPTHGSNVDILNIHESKQTLDLSRCFKVFRCTTADASDKRQQQPDSTSSTSTLATTVTADGNFDL
ncbi:hypothetical protein Tco_1090689 [Tanacetum coccineum]|uniref:Uncharacterized protein n=1 Tax=Tanacetum coccineum TaxID=301880 RepID=A0ABQ5I606_9ASTR